MSEQAPIVARTSPVLRSLVALLGACLAVYWCRQIALGVPDAYPGQTRGGLFLALAIFTNSAGSLATKPYLQGALALSSMVCVAVAVYAVFG